VWAFDTLGYATSGTFPSGGPASALTAGGGGPFGGAGGRAGTRRFGAAGSSAGVQLFGSGGSSSGAAGAGPAGPPPGSARSSSGAAGGPPGFPGGRQGFGAGAGGGGGGGALGAPIGNAASITTVLSYVKQHGGGTIAVSSQSSAAQAIIALLHSRQGLPEPRP